jgi:hypothetical protein
MYKAGDWEGIQICKMLLYKTGLGKIGQIPIHFSLLFNVTPEIMDSDYYSY